MSNADMSWSIFGAFGYFHSLAGLPTVAVVGSFQSFGTALRHCTLYLWYECFGKWLHEYQIMFMYCLVNKLFKDDIYRQKNKKVKKREHTISQNSVVFSIRKNISEDKLASFYMQEKNMYVSFAWEDHAATVL